MQPRKLMSTPSLSHVLVSLHRRQTYATRLNFANGMMSALGDNASPDLHLYRQEGAAPHGFTLCVPLYHHGIFFDSTRTYSLRFLCGACSLRRNRARGELLTRVSFFLIGTRVFFVPLLCLRVFCGGMWLASSTCHL